MALTLTDIYNKLTWKNSPDHTTPINEDNLNHIENGIKNNNTGLRAAETAINNLSTAVGNTQNLDTSSKEVVGAVNELNQHLTELESEVPKMANPILDYANPLHTFDSTHTSYTATKDCYIVGTISTQDPSTPCRLLINSTIVYVGYSPAVNTTYGFGPANIMLKVKAGDIVSLTGYHASTQLHAFDVVS